MDTSTAFEDSFLEAFEVSSSTSSAIQVSWNIKDSNSPYVEGFRVHYQKIASTYIQYGPQLKATDNEYEISNLVADTYYKVCLVVYRNDSIPFRECTDASTTNWQLPVSIGSSIGALLALSMIVLIVLLSRCQIPLKYKGKKSKRSSKYDTISSTYHEDQYEFSETVTQGNEDDFASEFDEEAYYELSVNDTKRSRPTVSEKGLSHNGLCRGHVHPHCGQHSQQRYSLGKITCPQSHHHTRQFRAYSIQPDGNACFYNQPCSPLAKEPRKISFTAADATDSQRTAADCTSDNCKATTVNERSPVSNETCVPLLEKTSPAQAFSFIDAIPEVSTIASSRSNTSLDSKTKAEKPTEQRQLLITDIDGDDLCTYGATGGVGLSKSADASSNAKNIEMTSTKRMLALPESVSFDEHTV